MDTAQESARKSCDEIIKRDNSEYDAVHPRFQKPPEEEELRQYETENSYYCSHCNQFFAPTNLALKTHFDGKMVRHEPCGSCIYCTGPVYEYTINNQRHLYHNCNKK